MINPVFRGFLGFAAMTVLAVSASANVLVNPGFEDPPFPGAEDPGAGSGWSTFGAAFRVQQAGPGPCDPISCAGAHGGTVAFKTFGVGGAFQDFAASEGELWDAGAWAINPANADAMAPGQVAAVNIEWLDAGGTMFDAVLGGTITGDDPTDVWTLLTASGVAPAGTAFARIVLITGDFLGLPGGGAPRFDDAFFDTRVIPIPGAVLLLGSGLMGLFGFRRKKAA